MISYFSNYLLFYLCGQLEIGLSVCRHKLFWRAGIPEYGY